MFGNSISRWESADIHGRSLIPQLVAIGLIAVPPNTAPGAPKPPGIIIKSLDDKKSVVVQMCVVTFICFFCQDVSN